MSDSATATTNPEDVHQDAAATSSTPEASEPKHQDSMCLKCEKATATASVADVGPELAYCAPCAEDVAKAIAEREPCLLCGNRYGARRLDGVCYSCEEDLALTQRTRNADTCINCNAAPAVFHGEGAGALDGKPWVLKLYCPTCVGCRCPMGQQCAECRAAEMEKPNLFESAATGAALAALVLGVVGAGVRLVSELRESRRREAQQVPTLERVS